MSALNELYQWIINSPNLIQHQDICDDLHSLATNALPSNTEYQGNPRLGFIYQHLCAQAFLNSPHYHLLAEEIQLRDQGRTLGAIDLIVRNLERQRTEHWEVAIKFYLLYQGSWFGPNAHDQLEHKLPRMLNHQLAMSNSDVFNQQHRELAVDTHHLLLQGRLYTNPFIHEATPTHCETLELNPSQINGYWCYFSQAGQIGQPLYELPKIRWATGKAPDAPIVEPRCDRFIHGQTDCGQFWFVVPDVWPNN